MSDKLESKIQKEILLFLESLGSWSFKTIESNKRGVPDIIGCLDGRFVGIEVKRPGKAPTVIQSIQLNNIEKAGGISFVATSAAETEDKLREHFEF